MKAIITRASSLICIVLPIVAVADGPARDRDIVADEPARDHDIVAEDYFSIGAVTGCAMSPTGRYVAYTETRWDPPADKRNSDIWVVTTDTHETTRLTFDAAGDGSVQWSPDDQWIYFASARTRAGEDKPPHNGKKQVWRIKPDGADLQAVTRIDDGIGAYQLASDAHSLYYTISKEVVDDDPWKDLREEFDTLDYGHGVEEYTQIWRLDLRTWRKKKLIDEKRVISEFAVSRDQRRIAMLTTPTGELITNEGWSRVDIHDTTTDKVRTLPDKQWRADAPSPYGWLLGLAWSDDGRMLSFRCDFDGYPGEVFIAEFSPERHLGTMKLIRPGTETQADGDEVYITGHMEWVSGRRDFCFVAEDHARSRVYRIRNVRAGRHGPSDALTGGDVAVKTFSFNVKGDALAVVMPTLTHPPDVFTLPVTLAAIPHPLTRITKVNPQVDTWKLPTIQTVKWKSKDGTDVEGILELPPNYEPGTPLPTIIELHGGPTAASMLEMRFWIYGRVMFPARGWALLSPNYRGSTGFGDKFLTELVGHKNDRDVADIMAGADWMIEQGIADPDKMAVMGWSNGGYLTNCLIAHTTRFKAASSGAGVFDTVLQWLTEDTPGHVINFNQGFPWDKTEQMQKGSALYHADKIITPTLIHVGENDPRCPPGHSRGLYRALHHYVKVPTELIVYPGEGHGLTTYKHRKAKMQWDIKWFDHHVLGETTDDPETVPAVD